MPALRTNTCCSGNHYSQVTMWAPKHLQTSGVLKHVWRPTCARDPSTLALPPSARTCSVHSNGKASPIFSRHATSLTATELSARRNQRDHKTTNPIFTDGAHGFKLHIGSAVHGANFQVGVGRVVMQPKTLLFQAHETNDKTLQRIDLSLMELFTTPVMRVPGSHNDG